MEPVLETVKLGIANRDPTIISVLVAIIVVLLSIVIVLLRSRSTKRRGILLVGLSDSGKTLLYSRLIAGKYVETHTSIKENAGSYLVPGKNEELKVVDIPGYERIRGTFFDQYKGAARGLIFMIDSLTFQKDIKDVAEYLYQLLSDPVITQNSVSVLVACNKNDVTLAKGAKVIQAQLEKEMTLVRRTQSSALQDLQDSGTQVFLGHKERDFQFSDLRRNKVEFCECSAHGNKDFENPELQTVKDWLLKSA